MRPWSPFGRLGALLNSGHSLGDLREKSSLGLWRAFDDGQKVRRSRLASQVNACLTGEKVVLVQASVPKCVTPWAGVSIALPTKVSRAARDTELSSPVTSWTRCVVGRSKGLPRSFRARSACRYFPSVEGEHVSSVYRQRVTLASGRFAMIDDGLGFQLVPWRPAVEQHVRRQVYGVVTAGGRVDRSFGRQ
jgi:hypothetical protein